MGIRRWLAVVASLIAITACLYLPFVPQTVLPFEARPLDRHTYVVTASSHGVALPAGLLSGDVVDTGRMDRSSRLGLTTSSVVPAGSSFTLAVIRDGREQRVPVSFVPMPATPFNVTGVVLGIGVVWLIAALGLLILWCGRRLAAIGVGIWCLAQLCWEIPIRLPLPLAVAGWTDVAGMALFYSGTLVGLYLLAEDLAWENVFNRTRRRARAGFMGLVVVYLFGFTGNDLAFHLDGHWLFDPAIVNGRIVAHIAAFAIPVAMLVSRYRRVAAADRARIRWVLVSLGGVVAAYLVNSDFGIAHLSGIASDVLWSGFTAASFIGFTYAVLRHRLVGIHVVLNRALVYATAITALIAAFGLLESLLEEAALGDRASTLLALAVPLGLGIVFDQMHKRIERWVEYLFFHKQFRAEAALSQFARECGYITSMDVLLDRTLGEVMRHAGAPAVAIYEHAGSGYRCLRQRGRRDFPGRLGIDDPACVRLRANLTETQIDGLGSGLGPDGLAFPVALRGALVGVMVLSPRPGELYAPSEKKILQHLTHEVGASLHAMYVNQTQSFLTEVVNGSLQASDKARSAAKQLLRVHIAA